MKAQESFFSGQVEKRVLKHKVMVIDLTLVGRIMTETQLDDEPAAPRNTPFIVHEEDAPIIPMELVQAMAEAYQAYEEAWEVFGNEPRTPLEVEDRLVVFGRDNNPNIVQLPLVTELLWQVRGATKEAVRERGIPIDRRQDVYYQSSVEEYDGQKIIGRHYVGLGLHVPKVCAHFIRQTTIGNSEPVKRALELLNYHLLSLGVAALEVERIGHDGLDTWLRYLEKSDSTPTRDQSGEEWELYETRAEQAKQAWDEAEAAYRHHRDNERK